MTNKPKDDAQKAKVEADLDEALAATFPASDPPAMSEPAAGSRPTRKAPKPPAEGKVNHPLPAKRGGAGVGP
jgi:hypothetical protein